MPVCERCILLNERSCPLRGCTGPFMHSSMFSGPAASAGDLYAPLLAAVQNKGPDQCCAASLVRALEARLRAGDGLNRVAPERGFLTEFEADVLLQPGVADVEGTHLGNLARAVEVAVCQFVALHVIVCLRVSAAAEEIEVPLAGKRCLQARLPFVCQCVAHEQLLFAPGDEEDLADVHGERTQRARTPDLSGAGHRDGDAALFLFYCGGIGLFDEIPLVFEADRC